MQVATNQVLRLSSVVEIRYATSYVPLSVFNNIVWIVVQTMTVPYDGFDEHAFDRFVTETLEEFPTPGLAILVVNGEDTWTKCFGYTDLAEKAPVTPHSLFCVDSLTKSFTAAIAGYVVESPDHPSIGWNTTLADIIPEDFVLAAGTPLGDWATKHVTIEDALSHRTGMARHDMARTNGDPSLGELVRSLRYVRVPCVSSANFKP